MAGGLSAAAWLATRFDPWGQAQAAYDRRDYRAALKSAREHLKNWPTDRRASLLAARSLSRLGRSPAAEEHYKHAGPLDPDDLQARAYGFVNTDQPGRAAEVYEEILKLRPADALALKRLAAIRMSEKRWPLVLELADRLSRIPSEAVAGYTMAGIGHHESKHYTQAVASFERVLQLDPELVDMPLPRPLFWNNFALDLIGLGRAGEARAYLQKVLANTDDAGLMEVLGLTYHMDGNPVEAERCWRQAVAWDPGNVEAWLELARLAMKRGKWDEAIRMLEPAAERSPEMVEPVYSLSLAYRQLGKTAEAVRYQQRAEELRRLKPPRGGMGEMPVEPAVDVRTASPGSRAKGASR